MAKITYAPLPGSFMVLSMLGFIISLVYMNSGKIDKSFGFSFAFVFALMFIAAILSMTYGPVEQSFELDNLKKNRK